MNVVRITLYNLYLDFYFVLSTYEVYVEYGYLTSFKTRYNM